MIGGIALMSEIWCKLRGTNYDISESGGVRNSITETRIMPQTSRNGSKRVTLYDPKSKIHYTKKVDELVAMTFYRVGSREFEVIHVDGDPANNHYKNLIIRDKEVRLVRNVDTGQVFKTQSDCCYAYDIPPGALSECLNGKRKRYKGMRFEYISG